MKIDLHVHSRERSECGKAPEEEQIRAAINAGLDALVFTDHHRPVSPERLAELNGKYAPFRIFGGAEITTDGEDFLVLGIQDSALESHEWDYASLHAFVRKHKGFIALAHPFRFHDDIKVDLERLVPDAIEIRTPNTPERQEEHIREIAMQLHIPTLCNSDSHTTERIGRYYNVLPRTPSDERALIAMLKSGQFEGYVSDAKLEHHGLAQALARLVPHRKAPVSV
jgi:predicted metal-dependent phosphoesterase TrpH